MTTLDFSTPETAAAATAQAGRCFITGCTAAAAAEKPFCQSHWDLVPAHWQRELPRAFKACAEAKLANLDKRERNARRRYREHAFSCAIAAVECRLAHNTQERA
jgi:hypothetical protein